MAGLVKGGEIIRAQLVRLQRRARHAQQRHLVHVRAVVGRAAVDDRQIAQAFDEAPVRRSAAYLLSGAVGCEFRTTVVAQLHTEADFTAIGQWLAGAKRYYLQGFVDSGNLIGSGLSAAPKAEMERFLAAVKPFIPTVELRGV